LLQPCIVPVDYRQFRRYVAYCMQHRSEKINMPPLTPATIARRRLLGAIAAAPAALALPAVAATTDDSAVLAAFQRWLDGHNSMHAAESDNATWEASYDSYLAAVYDVMELPAAGAVGMALKAYVVLNEEISQVCGPVGRHGASLVLPTADDAGPLPARIAAGLFDGCCRIVPELRRFASATRADVLTLAGEVRS